MSLSNAFLFYGPDVSNNSTFRVVLRQSSCVQLTPVELLRPPAHVRNILEMHDPFVMDVSGHSFAQIRHLHGLLESAGYQTYMYVQGHAKGSISESRIRDLTTQGLLQLGIPRCLALESFHPATQMVRHMNMVLREEGPTVPVPNTKSPAGKVPTEVDRLKAQQKQDTIMTKQRQTVELLQAKQRELAKKSREDMNKISSGA